MATVSTTKNKISDLDDISKKMSDKIITTDNIEFDDVSLKDVTLKIGTTFFKLSLLGKEDVYSFKSEIENELRLKLKEKLKDLRLFIDKNMTEAFSIVNTIKSEYSRKETILTERLANANPMPPIQMREAERGLSVMPMNSGGIGWIIRRTYWPKFVDRVPIVYKLQQKMISQVLIVIRTEKEQVKEITVRRPSDFQIFDHYHKNCWGDWRWQDKKVNSPNDALVIADEAIAVLENINSMSMANNNPTGLPNIATVRRNLESDMVATRRRGRPRLTPIVVPAPAPRQAGRDVDVIETVDAWDTGIR